MKFHNVGLHNKNNKINNKPWKNQLLIGSNSHQYVLKTSVQVQVLDQVHSMYVYTYKIRIYIFRRICLRIKYVRTYVFGNPPSHPSSALFLLRSVFFLACWSFCCDRRRSLASHFFFCLDRICFFFWILKKLWHEFFFFFLVYNCLEEKGDSATIA